MEHNQYGLSTNYSKSSFFKILHILNTYRILQDSGSLRCPAVPLQHSVELLSQTLHLLPEGKQEYRMATALHQTFMAFVQDEENSGLPT